MLAPIVSNLALRAWFKASDADTSTNKWLATQSSEEWLDPLNWSLFAPPVAGQTVIVPADASLRLNGATPRLARFELAQGATLTFEGWETFLEADEIEIAGTVTHLPQTVTESDPDTGEWVPQHRIWFKGSDFLLAEGGTLDADHMGYPCGAGPGVGRVGGYSNAGGGGYGGRGGDGFAGSTGGATNGLITDPWQPGSGGGWISVGRPAGGAIRIELINSIKVEGVITACGEDGARSHGSGGSGGGIAIWCNTFHGTASGLIRVDGGRAYGQGGSGGGGRIALHYNRMAQAALAEPRPPVRFSAHAWRESLSNSEYTRKAEMGTLYLTDLTLLAESATAPAIFDSHRFWHTRIHIGEEFACWEPQSLVISNSLVAFPVGFELKVAEELLLFGDEPPLVGYTDVSAGLVLEAAAIEACYGAELQVGGELRLSGKSWLYPQTKGYGAALVSIKVGGDVVLGPESGIDANEQGYMPQSGNLNGSGAGKNSNSAGGYGGAGGGANPSETYGLAGLPLEYGSPGGWRAWGGDTEGGRGGGAIQLLAGGNIKVDGLLTANGGKGWFYQGGAGSGGSILVAAGGRISGSGLLQANGGAGEGGRAPGGGGRIALWHHVPRVEVERRIAAKDASGLTRSDTLNSFKGGLEAAVTPTTESTYHDPEPGTTGFYTIAGTMFILR